MRAVAIESDLEWALAKYYGVFDWLASLALNHAKGSAARLFLLIYGVGGLIAPFIGIKLIDLIVHNLLGA